MWIFFKPLRWDLWLTIFIACIIIGIVLRILEYEETTDTNTITLLFWFPIAILAFSENYQSGSFVKDYLINDQKFNESKLKDYAIIEEYHDAMTLGISKGLSTGYSFLKGNPKCHLKAKDHESNPTNQPKGSPSEAVNESQKNTNISNTNVGAVPSPEPSTDQGEANESEPTKIDVISSGLGEIQLSESRNVETPAAATGKHIV
ncbi:hypothetical protein ACH5RR_006404 [Cinchona calisaya]|uniref:Uncharacterized protein n=1 Tax=Cinchona calisaya TaxID=153742 RepID=A0ABD3ANW7_9GENT